jgi:hypothetical protein
VDHDGDVIRIVEGRRAAIERGIIEVPLRRSDLPDELRKIVPVFVVAGPAAFGGEIILVPPLQLGLWRQRRLVGFLAADQITAHGDQALQRSGQSAAMMSAVRPPQSKPGEDRLLDLESIHQAMMSRGDRRCWPLRNVSLERKRVVP